MHRLHSRPSTDRLTRLDTVGIPRPMPNETGTSSSAKSSAECVSAEIASRDGKPDQQVVISVRDDGIGIAQEMLPRVFDMFTLVNRSLGRSQGGLGIGLTLVQSLVHMHGGSVQVFSDGPGQGSGLGFPSGAKS